METGVSPDRDSELLQLVEDVGLSLDGFGLPRIAGRIVGWLLVCDPPHQSADELQQVLSASKGSISTNVRLLRQRGVLERVSLPGQRRTFYRISSRSWSEQLRARMATISSLRRLAERGLELLENEPATRRKRLSQLFDIYSFLEQEMPVLLDRFARQQKEDRP